jgi:DNA uptake protein ComE-like DNA-binding protein
MSTAPGRFRPQPATGASTTGGPSVLWRFVASSWLLLLLVGAGATAWLAFGLLAIIARRRSWGIIAGAYAVAAILAALPGQPARDILQGSLYLVALVHGLVLNQGWLLLLWGRRENGLTVFGNLPGGTSRNTPPTGRRRQPAAIPQEAEKLLGSAGTSRSDYVDDSAPAPRKRQTRAERRAQQDAAAAPAPAPQRTNARPASAPPASAPPASAPARATTVPRADAELVDVNTANQRTLARLTGMDRGRAKAAIADRTTRGGFGSLEDFATTAGLQPHEIVRLRTEAYCSARPRAKRSFGRRVDY